ncbi:MAG: hypothetical protein ACRDIY_17340 [Chloroflexota bacterium]
MWNFGRLATLLVPTLLVFSLVSPALAANGTQPLPSPTVVDYPTDMPAISVAVIHDGLDSHGQWVQTVRLTIEPGGTLADASLVAFGDVLHVDPLFQAARHANPHLDSPAMIPIGQHIDLQIDPSSAFVLQTVLHGSNTLVRRFTNGAVDTSYIKPNGSVTRVLTFPAGKPTDFFAFPASPNPIKVRPGGRVVELQLAQGQTFADVVNQTYGLTSYNAAVDLTRQTGWDPTRWPPATGSLKQVVTEPPAVYAAAPRDVAAIPNPDPVGRTRQIALHEARRKAGLYITREETFETVYHVAVTDPSVTASGLSDLIYGSPTHRLEIARAAGYEIPAGSAANDASFDPHLLGRAFDVAVDYQDEDFVVSRVVGTHDAVQTELVDGARITTYPGSAHGLIELIRYPTQYKRILYRPSKASLTVARGIAFFHLASAPGLPSSVANTLADEDAARILWQWSPGIPREPGDIADSVQLVNGSTDPIMEVLVGPPVPRTVVGDLVDRLGLENPLIAVVGLVVAGTLLALAVDLGRRRAQRARSSW